MPLNLELWGGGAQSKPRTKKERAASWGSKMGMLPPVVNLLRGVTQPRVRVLRMLHGEPALNNRPLNVIHNHSNRRPHIVYEGYSKTTPDHHVFRCIARSDPPAQKVTLSPFDSTLFTADTKASQGLCSMRLCLGEAVMMDTKGKMAYCERCIQEVQEGVPCSWTSIFLCTNKWRLAYCEVCRKFEVPE